jgi:hypothetical protein
MNNINSILENPCSIAPDECYNKNKYILYLEKIHTILHDLEGKIITDGLKLFNGEKIDFDIYIKTLDKVKGQVDSVSEEFKKKLKDFEEYNIKIKIYDYIKKINDIVKNIKLNKNPINLKYELEERLKELKFLFNISQLPDEDNPKYPIYNISKWIDKEKDIWYIDNIYSVLRKTELRLINIQLIIINCFYNKSQSNIKALDECEIILNTYIKKLITNVKDKKYGDQVKILEEYSNKLINDIKYIKENLEVLESKKVELLNNIKYLNFKDRLHDLPVKNSKLYPYNILLFKNFKYEKTNENYIKYLELIENLQIRVEIRLNDICIIKMNSFNKDFNIKNELDECKNILDTYVKYELSLAYQQYKNIYDDTRLIEKLKIYSEQIKTYIENIRNNKNLYRKTYKNYDNNDEEVKYFMTIIDSKKYLYRTIEKMQNYKFEKIGSTDLNYKETYIYKHYLGYIENYSTELEHNKFNILKDNPEVIDHLYDIVSIPKEKHKKIEDLNIKEKYNEYIKNGILPYVKVINDEKIDKVDFIKFYPTLNYYSVKDKKYQKTYNTYNTVDNYIKFELFEYYKDNFKDILEKQNNIKNNKNDYNLYPNLKSIREIKGVGRFNSLERKEVDELLIYRKKSAAIEIKKNIIEGNSFDYNKAVTKFEKNKENKTEEVIKKLEENFEIELRSHLIKGKKYLARISGDKDCNNSVWGRFDSNRVDRGPYLAKKNSICNQKLINRLLEYFDPNYTDSDGILQGKDGKKSINVDRRPFLFGYSGDIVKYMSCYKYLRLLLSEGYNQGDLIEWTLKLNKLFTYCILDNKKNILFPLIFSLPNKYFPARYIIRDKNFLKQEFTFLGLIEISFYDNKTTKSIRKLYSFVFMNNKNNNINILDLYSRLIEGGTYMPMTTITHTEMRIIGINYNDKENKTCLFRINNLERIKSETNNKYIENKVNNLTDEHIILVALEKNKDIIKKMYGDKLKEIKIVKYHETKNIKKKNEKSIPRFIKDPIHGFGTIYCFDDAVDIKKPDTITKQTYDSIYLDFKYPDNFNVDNSIYTGGNYNKIVNNKIFSNKITYATDNILGYYFNKSLEIDIKFYSYYNQHKNIIKINNPNKYLDNVYFITNLFYKYYNISKIAMNYDKNKNNKNKILSQTIIQNRKESKHPLWKLSKINLWLDKNYKSILNYNPISQFFIYFIEVLNFFDLKNKDILDISNKIGVTETINFRNNQYNLNVKSNDFLYLKCNILKVQQEEQENINLLYTRINKKFNPIIMDIFPTYEIFKEKINKKYDIIFLSPDIGKSKIGYFLEQLNSQSLFTFIIFSLLSLNIGGDLCLRSKGFSFYFTIDCIYFLSIYFENINLFRPEILYPDVLAYNYVICKKFKGIPKINEYLDIVKQMYNNDPSGGFKFNVLDEELRKKYWVTEPITNTDIHYIVRIFSDDIRKTKEYLKIVDDVKDYNNKIYKNNYLNWLNLNSLLDKIMNNDKDTIDNLKQIQLISSIEYAEKYDLPINPIFDILKTKEEIINIFLKNIDEPIKYLDYKITIPEKTIKLGEFYTEETQQQKDFNNHHRSMQIILDTREKGSYGLMSYNIKYFRELSHYLEKRFNTINLTQGGIKLYEMLKTHNLIDKEKDTLRTFHLCELPGSFLFSIDLFLNNETKIKDWHWTSQSLLGDVDNGFTNKFKLINSHPDSWNFGPLKNGNITKMENLKYYIDHKNLGLADLITSDCGLDLLHSNLSSKLLFATMLIIMCGCKKGANYLQKIYLPLNNLVVSLIYICANYFNNLYIYKPVVNQFSTEIYLIFTEFRGMPLKNKEKLVSLYETYITSNENLENFSLLQKIPDYFLDELLKGLLEFSEMFNKTIKDALNLSDFFLEYNDEHLKKIYEDRLYKIRKEKLNDWVSLFNFRNNKKTFMDKKEQMKFKNNFFKKLLKT